jgi:Holliday junction resolvase RusA-like endonuclease
MNYSLSLELDIHKTDPNKMLGRNKFAKHSVFKKVKAEIHKLCLGKRPPEPLTSFHISATRYCLSFMDWDNFVSSLKPVIDGLVLAKVIKDDSWTYIKHIETDQVKSKIPKLIIEVREV